MERRGGGEGPGGVLASVGVVSVRDWGGVVRIVNGCGDDACGGWSLWVRRWGLGRRVDWVGLWRVLAVAVVAILGFVTVVGHLLGFL